MEVTNNNAKGSDKRESTSSDKRVKEVTVEVTKTSQEGVTCDGY